ncbi:MAG: hypothetical protein ABF820_05575 [Sporolactobacillus sp.]
MNSEKRRWNASLFVLILALAAAAIASVTVYQMTAAKSAAKAKTGMVGGWMRQRGAQTGMPQTSGKSSRRQAPSRFQKHGGAPSGKFAPSGTRQQMPKQGKSSFNERRSAQNGFGRSRTNAATSSTLSVQEFAVGAYALLFLAACASWLFLRRRRKTLDNSDEAPNHHIVSLVLAAGLLLRIGLAPWFSGHMDLMLFQNWAERAAANLTHVYQTESIDYPPLYLYVLYALGKLAALPGLSGSYTWLLKLPAIFCDTLTAWLLYRIAKRCGAEKLGWLLLVFYLFNPAVLIDSTVWGQVDSIFTLLIVAAVTLLMERRLTGATIVFALSVMMKPQGLIFLPVLAYSLLKYGKLKNGLTSFVAFGLTIVVLALPFSFHAQGGALWLVQLMQRTVSEYPFASVNAFNFFSLIGGNYKAQSAILFLLSYQTWGYVAIIAVSLLSLWVIWKQRGSESAVAAALLQISGVFTFASGMHERYLFPAIALALLAYIYFRRTVYLYLAIGFSVTNLLNIYIVYYGSLSGEMSISYHWPMILTSLLNTALFLILLGTVLTRGRSKPIRAEKEESLSNF